MAKKILIVDDEPNIVISLEFLMAQNGYNVFIARNGEQAMELLPQVKPDLILLDVMLPNRSGFEILQLLRKDNITKSIKVILLTAKGRDQDITKGISLGADAYVTKPFSTRALVEKVKEVLNKPDAN
jgi:two-component system alkaline phosphatase synthesis response regulator PhoP